MGVTFIGNPFDQDEEYDESDWDMNAVEEWIMPPQEVAFFDPIRAAFDVPEISSSESDEDYMPEEDNEEDDFENIADMYVFESNEEGEEEEEEEELDYVTYPLRDETDSEPEKPSTTDASILEENSDTD